MKTNKILLGALTAAIAFFFLGWIIYGMLLADFMQNNFDQSLMKAEEDMIWWAMILANLASGLLLAFIISWSNAKCIGEGAKIGGITGLLMALGVDLSFYSMSDLYANLTAVFVDVIIVTVMWAAVGLAVAWVMGIKKEEA